MTTGQLYGCVRHSRWIKNTITTGLWFGCAKDSRWIENAISIGLSVVDLIFETNKRRYELLLLRTVELTECYIKVVEKVFKSNFAKK